MNKQNNAVTSVPAIGNALSPRLNQVEEQVKVLETFAADVQNMVETLEERLSCVTRPRVEPPAGMGETPREMLVPLAMQLRDVADKLNRSINGLRELNGAIELP